ncbi:protein-glutamate O-methyltransferase CheR [Leptolyngbya sp. GB1-A1]|uniref:CheR family methyltransferase n=1 Tax=Leptolyngbya sp. GB1-A1 TaxID=2933908 RepID=UPI003299EAD5
MPVLMQLAELEDLEIQLLLEGVNRYYGFDFRSYSSALIKRQIRDLIQTDKLPNISRLQEKILHERAYMERFLLNLSANRTGMFHDPSFYLAFRTQVVPLLRTYPSVRIWYAGCMTGEEVYAMAILLWEEGIYPRCRIYATDINESALAQARTGVFTLGRTQEYALLYQQAGGEQLLSEYYTVRNNSAIVHSFLKENLVFAAHNLVTDASFNEFNVILCRNVLTFLNSELQAKIHQLFHDSLGRFGILGLGQQESLKFSPYQQCYELFDPQAQLYRRIA